MTLITLPHDHNMALSHHCTIALSYLWTITPYCGTITLSHCTLSHYRTITPSYYCKVTGRRHRVSPCRSAYFASPWWLLTLSLVDAVEKQLYCSQSRDGIWRCGSRPSLFYDNPEYKRHRNYTKTDQLPISEVITGLPRPYHHTIALWHHQAITLSLSHHHTIWL